MSRHTEKMLIGGLFFLVLLMVNSAYAADLSFTEAEDPNLIFFCSSAGKLCNSSTVCNITVFNPANVLIVNNSPMQSSLTHFNFTVVSDKSIGDYETYTYCCEGDNCQLSNFTYHVTPWRGMETNPLTIIIAAAAMAFLFIIVTFAIPKDEKKDGGFNDFKYVNYVFLTIALFIMFVVIPSALVSERSVVSIYKWGHIGLYIFFVACSAIALVMVYKKFNKMMNGGEEDS